MWSVIGMEGGIEGHKDWPLLYGGSVLLSGDDVLSNGFRGMDRKGGLAEARRLERKGAVTLFHPGLELDCPDDQSPGQMVTLMLDPGLAKRKPYVREDGPGNRAAYGIVVQRMLTEPVHRHIMVFRSLEKCMFWMTCLHMGKWELTEWTT